LVMAQLSVQRDRLGRLGNLLDLTTFCMDYYTTFLYSCQFLLIQL
jgi:hypothetical protein